MTIHKFLLTVSFAAALALSACGSTQEQANQPTATIDTSTVAPTPTTPSASDPAPEPTDEPAAEPTAEPTAEPADEPIAEPVEKEIYSLGDTAKIEWFHITVEMGSEPKEDWGTPASGKRFIAVDVTLKNTGDESQEVAMMLQMFMVDSTGTQYAFDHGASWESVFTLNGAIPADEERQGTVIFQIPEDAEGLQFVFRTIDRDTTSEAERVVFALGE
jgi:hypothetical protein